MEKNGLSPIIFLTRDKLNYRPAFLNSAGPEIIMELRFQACI